MSKLPTPTAIDPIACAVPLAKNAPPAPVAMAGIAGIEPTVINTAAMAVIVFGCSVVRKPKACEALRSHVGACAVVVVPDVLHMSFISARDD